MSANRFGERFQITTFGESHGPALGVVIDGCPAGVRVDEGLLSRELERRRPGQSHLTTARTEMDRPEILSGVFEGRTLGTPIAVIVRNQDARSADYETVKAAPRAGHADDVWRAKFGHSDHRGGGRSSGRETLSRVIGGAFARMLVQQESSGTQVLALTSKVGALELSATDRTELAKKRPDVDAFPARFPSSQAAQAETLILAAKEAGDSLGGTAEIQVHGAPAGWGQPVFHKIKADLATAYFGVGATSAVEIGAGMEASAARGLDFHGHAESYGGVRGGITTGEPIVARVHFKPTSSILDIAKKGRHDPFIVTRAIPVLEAMTWLVLADHLLWSKTDRTGNS